MNRTLPTNGMRKYLLMAALMLAGVMTAQAEDYVITYTNNGTTYYLGMNGTTLVAKTTPDATCVWQGYYYGDYDLSTYTRINIRNKNNTNYYLYYDGSSIVASTTAQRRWYGGNGSSIYYNNGGTTRYIHNSGSTITASNSGTNAFIPYTVTVTSVASISTNPTISGADVLTATGNSTYTASGAAYRIGYTNYNFNNANHYVDADGNSFTGTPANANITYSWSLTDNAYATVNSTSGVVTVSSLPEYDITLTLTVTATVTGGTPAAPANTTLTGTKQITIQGTKPSAPTITVNGTSVTLAEVVKTNDNNGNTHVILTGSAHVKGNVYGGGNQADVQGNTNVELR